MKIYRNILVLLLGAIAMPLKAQFNGGMFLKRQTLSIIGDDTSGRYYINGTYAASCKDYQDGGSYFGNTGDGVYLIKPGPTPFKVFCDMTADGGRWTLVYKHSSGVANVPYTLWDSIVTESTAPTNKGALEAQDYAVRTLIDSYSGTFQNARVEVWKSGSLRAYVRFDAVGADKYTWYSRSRIQASSWGDLTTAAVNFFSLPGHDAIGRWLYISSSYGGCAADYMWFVAFGSSNDPCAGIWSVSSAYRVAYCEGSSVCVSTSANFTEADTVVFLMR